MNEIEVTGIITSSMPIGDYDKRIVILTKEIGRISAFVKFARRTNNRFLGSTREFICARFKIYQGSSSYTVTDIDVINYFEYILNDMDKTNYALYFADVVNYYTRENENTADSLEMLYGTLQILNSDIHSYEFIKSVFELKTLVIMGEYPYLYRYQDTKEKMDFQKKYFFSIEKNGIVKGDGIPINHGTVRAMNFVIESKPYDIYKFRLKKELEEEFIDTVSKYFQSKVNYKFKSLEAFKWQEEMKKLKKLGTKKG